MQSRFSHIFVAAVCPMVFCASSLFAQTLAGNSIEVVYNQYGSIVQTYDIDRQTGFPTQQGQGVTLDFTSGPATIVPDRNDHFLYVTAFDNNQQYLWVYATDSTGVPQLPAVQALTLLGNSFSPLSIDPDGTVAYATRITQNTQNQQVFASIYSFRIDPTTGKVNEGAKVATYPANGPCASGANFPSFSVIGFNPNGTQMYDSWYCPYFNGYQGFYYSRPVNQKTGALGSETQIAYWSNGETSSTNLVNITPSSILYFDVPTQNSYGQSELGVSSLSGTPLFNCTATMLEACGYATWETPDPSGRYVFFQVSPDNTLIAKIELAQQKVVETGNYVNGFVVGFSPDDVLVYTQNQQVLNPSTYSIYVFDPATGGVTYTGGQIEAQTEVSQFVSALRW